ncbi:MAG: hypothetical protein HQK65_13440 [Desulfamplus sp.]|nr:hypothetical protein [Desulfamplus sp.]
MTTDNNNFFSELKNKIDNDGLSAIEQAKLIKEAIINNNEKINSSEERTTNRWRQLGDILIKHKKTVEAENKKWVDWCYENLFSRNGEYSFGKKRCEQSIWLAERGDRIKPYYYMGIDRLYYFFNSLSNENDLELYKNLINKYEIFSRAAPQSEDERIDACKRADIVQGYIKFNNNVNNKNYDKEMVLKVLESGGEFKEKEYKYLSDPKLSHADIENFLIQMIINGSSPLNSSTSTPSNENTQVLLSKVCQNVSVYLEVGKAPIYLDKLLVEKSIMKLNSLMAIMV